MRIVILIMILLAGFVGHADAVAVVNGESIAAAQDYGRKKADLPLAEFFSPWTVYEEKAVKVNALTERAYVYTPFLLLAADARDKTLNGQPVKIADSGDVLTDYNGFVIFCVTIFGYDAALGNKVTVSLKQGGKTQKANSVTTLAADNVQGAAGQRPVYGGQFYAYFLAEDVATDKTAMLQVTAGDKRQRKFYFNMSGLK